MGKLVKQAKTCKNMHGRVKLVDTRQKNALKENPANSGDPAANWPSNSTVNTTFFMGKLRAKTGLLGFDLPTEAQWEYACRVGTTTALNSGFNLIGGAGDPNMAVVGRYSHNGGSSYVQDVNTSGATDKVGTYLANAWGLYDMHGNVREWCLDWFGLQLGNRTDPKGSTSGTGRSVRGGGWYYDAKYCMFASRDYFFPDELDKSELGFRICSPSSQP